MSKHKNQSTAPVVTEQVQAEALRSLTLTLRRVWPDGGCAYGLQGINGTVYVKAGFFGGATPPDTLTLGGLPQPIAKPEKVAAPAAPAAELPADTTSLVEAFQ